MHFDIVNEKQQNNDISLCKYMFTWCKMSINCTPYKRLDDTNNYLARF